MAVWERKAPGESVDRGINWNGELAGRTITNSNFVLVSGTVVLSAKNLVGNVASVRVSGGAEGESAVIRNDVELSTGESWQEMIYLKVETI